MTIESIIDQDTAMQYAQWALETKLWDGREIDPNWVKDAVIEKIALELFSKDPESFAFQKMAAELACLGAQEGEEEEIAAELASLQAFQNGIVIPAGFCKSLKKFWKKYKVEILVGIAVIAVVTAVAVGVLCAAGAAAAALATEKDKDKKDPPKPVPPTVPPENTTAGSSILPSWPPTDLALEKDAVVFNGQSLSYGDALQPKTIAQTLYSQADEGGLWKVYHASLQESPTSFVRSESHIPVFEPVQSIQQTSNIPVFSSKNYPPVTDRSNWVFKMIEWGLSDNNDEMTPPMPVLENAHSQVFRTVGAQRKDLAVLGINGIATSLHKSIQHAEYLAQFTKGLSVTWVHNHSNSIGVDAIECVTVNLPGASPNTQNLERDQWIAFHVANRDNPEAKFLQFCHSQGTIHTKNTLKSMPKEIQQRIIVVAIAPAVIITDDLCYKSFNYASKKDKVYLAEMMFTSMVDIEGGRQALADLEHLILLEPHEGASGIDHDFDSPTFTKIIEDHLTDYLYSQGTK